MLLNRQMQSENTPELQVDFKVDRPPPADSPPGDLLVKETVFLYEKEFQRMKKSETFVSLIEIACDCVKRANVVLYM